MAVLVLLGSCGIGSAQEETTVETTAQTTIRSTTEAPTTTQLEIPIISPEEAHDIIEKIIGSADDKNIELFIDEWLGFSYQPVNGYYQVLVIKYYNGNKASIQCVYYVERVTGEPFEHAFGWRPMKHMRYLKKTEEDEAAARAAATVLFPNRKDVRFEQFALRDSREYSMYWTFVTEYGPVPDPMEYYFCDLVTQELFYWELETDTLIPYAPAF